MSASNNEHIVFLDPAEILKNAHTLKPDENAVLEEINRKVTAAESFEKIVDYVFEATKDLFPCDRIAIAFLEDRGRRVVARAARTKYENISLSPSYSEGLQGSTLQEILQTNRIRIINDLPAYLASKPQSTSTALVVKEGLRSSLSCPLIVEERPVGFFFRNSKKPFAYGEHEVLMHVMMAERLSHAVEKAWRIAQLSAANQAYIEMLSFASHELKSPLATIGMECDMLLDGYFGEVAEQQRESLARMRRKVRLLIETTDDYLSLARYEGGQLKISIVDGVDVLAASIYPALEQLGAQAEARKISIEIEPEHGVETISCDPQALRAVFLNLIGNAIKYGVDGGKIKIALSRQPHVFTASVWNDGPGFPPEEQNKLFKRFSRLFVPEYKNVHGTGVGLYMVWQLIDLQNGRIGAQSKYGEWAEFFFSIPQG